MIDKAVSVRNGDDETNVRASLGDLQVAIEVVSTPAATLVLRVRGPNAGDQHSTALNPSTVAVDEVLRAAEQLVLLGTNAAQQRVAILVDLRAWTVVSEFACPGLRISHDSELIVCDSGMNAQAVFDVARNAFFGVPDVRTSILAALRGKQLSRRALAVEMLRHTAVPLLDEPVVRDALYVELQQALTVDRQAALARAAKAPIENGRSYELRRSYYTEVLIPLVVRLADARFAVLLARADALSTRGFASVLARAGLGDEAVRAIEGAWVEPVPSGYSRYYRANLLSALARYLEQSGQLSEVARASVARLCRQGLSQPDNERTLMEAMQLADDLDEDELIDRIRQFVDTDSFPVAAATDVRDELRQRASRILSRRLTLVSP